MKTISMIAATVILLSYSGFVTAQTSTYSQKTVNYDVPYTEVLTVQKDYYSVDEKGVVHTSFNHLFSKTYTQIELTKLSERNAATFSLTKTKDEYQMTVKRERTHSTQTKADISTADSKELTRWIISATMNGSKAYVLFDKESGRWYGSITK